MADPKKTDVNLTGYYAELNKFGKNGDYNRAIKVAKKSKYLEIYFVLLMLHNLNIVRMCMEMRRALRSPFICVIYLFFSLARSTRRSECSAMPCSVLHSRV